MSRLLGSVCLLFFCCKVLVSQNLVSNGDFEILANEYSRNVVKDWFLGGVSYNCNNDNSNFNHSKFPYQGACCDPKVHSYLKGNTKIWISNTIYKYEPDEEHWTHGPGIFTKLTKKLEIGKVYQVKINFYFPSVQMVDTNFYKHIGFTFLLGKPVMPESYKNWKFTNDVMVYDQWFEKVWYVRATCPLEYFLIGRSYDDLWPLLPREKRINSEYYVDNVSVEEVDESSVIGQNGISTPFCRCKPLQVLTPPKKFDQISVYFRSDSARLDPNERQRLDSVALYCQQNPMVAFELTGYTDDTGDNHLALSKLRVDSCLAYLTRRHKLNPIRFVSKFAGNVDRSNHNEAVKRNSRRVDVRPLSLRLDQVIYRKAYTSMQSDSAFYYLKIWLNMARPDDKLFALFDSRLSALHEHPKWRGIVKSVKALYKVNKKPELAFVLDSMYVVDQKYRTTEGVIGDLGDVYDPRDSLCFSFPKITEEQFKYFDSVNYQFLVRLIDKEGWPNESEVGERAGRAAFLIIDHWIDTISFQKYLPILQAKCLEGEASWQHYVTLFDRNELQCGRLQQYCTQYALDPQHATRYVLAPYDSETAVNERRYKLGLDRIRDFGISFTLRKTHIK